MASAKIKKGDNVVVLSGKDKGKTGTVAQVMPKDGKVVVEGVNIVARHRKPSQANPSYGGRGKASQARPTRRQYIGVLNGSRSPIVPGPK